MQWNVMRTVSLFVLGLAVATAPGQAIDLSQSDRPTMDRELARFVDRDFREVSDQHRGAPDLVSPLRGPAVADLRGMSAPWVTRGRAVTVHAEAFAFAMPGRDDRITFNLFDDVQFTGVFKRLEERVFNSYSWFGELEGVEGGQFILVSHKGVVAANIHAPGIGAFQVRYAADGIHVVQEVRRPAEASCGVNDLLQHPGGDIVQFRPRGMDGGESSIIDIMIVWTEDAQAEAGSVVAMETQAVIAVDSVNVAFENSLIDARLRLVFMTPLSGYFEAVPNSYNTELTRLTVNGDVQLDDVHTMRDEYGADLVAMFISHTAQGVAGLAWVLTDINAMDNDQRGFSVNHWALSSLPGVSVLAHELGHNFGCVHERENSSFQGAYPYAYGHELEVVEGLEDEAFHTIMAYDCVDSTPCQEAPHFSNPDVEFLGMPTGVAPGSPGQAHCAMVINNTAPLVAAFRASVVGSDVEGELTPATMTFDGELPDGDSRDPAISGNGRYVAFLSDATNLADPSVMLAGDQVYVLDRDADQDGDYNEPAASSVRLMSRADESGNDPADRSSLRPSMSFDGCRTVYGSVAENLVIGDENNYQDIFASVLVTDPPDPICSFPILFEGLTDRVSVSFDNSTTPNVERDPDGASSRPNVSRDGRFVAFQSRAQNLIDLNNDNLGDDMTSTEDIYLRDLDSARTYRISVGLGYDEFNIVQPADPDGASEWPAVSDRIGMGSSTVMVAFQSRATNLLSADGEDLGGNTQIYVREIGLFTSVSEMTRISIFDDGTELGEPANGHCFRPSISADGRFVSFESLATNLDGTIEDQNETYDVFVHDRDVSGSGIFDVPGNRATYLVSKSTSGDQANQIAWDARLSEDGGTVVFGSYASNLAAGDVNLRFDIFRRVWQSDGTGVTTLVSRSLSGQVGDDHSFAPSISNDGKQIAFYSLATNLYADDTNERADIFVFDNREVFGDIDGDCLVGFTDLNDLLDVWGQAVPSGTMGDLNGDGVVDFNDLQDLLDAWGDTC